ncbi:MAG: hypothetical protein ISR55_08920 [Bacteroidetes bacterium]|nr:hypothetical protein [Bacteroidota bacterium]
MKFFCTTICIMIFTSSLLAQEYDFSVSESKMVLGGGMNNSLSVNIYETNEKEITKSWKSLMKKEGAKVEVNSEIVANNVLLKELSDLPFNCFASIKSLGNNSYQLNTSVNLGGAFLTFNDHPDKYKIFSNFISEFAKATTLKSIENQLKSANQELSNKQSDLGKLIDTKDKLERNIEVWKNDIQKAEDNIQVNMAEQEDKKNELQVAKEEVAKVKAKLELVRKAE